VLETGYHLLVVTSALDLAPGRNKSRHLHIKPRGFVFECEQLIGFIYEKDVVVDLFFRGPVSNLFVFHCLKLNKNIITLFLPLTLKFSFHLSSLL
jgi:hypothetical protein